MEKCNITKCLNSLKKLVRGFVPFCFGPSASTFFVFCCIFVHKVTQPMLDTKCKNPGMSAHIFQCLLKPDVGNLSARRPYMLNNEFYCQRQLLSVTNETQVPSSFPVQNQYVHSFGLTSAVPADKVTEKQYCNSSLSGRD